MYSSKVGLLCACLIGLIALCASVAPANTLLYNHGESVSTIGRNPASSGTVSYLIDSSGYDGTCIFVHTIQNVTYGDCNFGPTYGSNQGTISFWYQPAQTTGNIVFCTGGDPSNGANSNFFGMYQNWYWGDNYPVVSASVGNNTWGYTVMANNPSSWAWNITQWYFITITYQMANSPTDYIDFYINGVQQTNYGAQGQYSPINPLLSGGAAQPIYFGCYQTYSISSARFDDIKITDSAVAAQPSSLVSQLKSLSDGSGVTINGKVTTTSATDFSGCFYIEDTDRSSGIRVESIAIPPDLQEGSIVNVVGTLDTNGDGERQIDDAIVTIISN